MDEIVESVKRVTAIMGEISSASEEQNAGIDQVNKAIMQMHEGTQQNASLVEEAAAAAASLHSQAEGLAEAVRVFRLASGDAGDGAEPSALATPSEAAMRAPHALRHPGLRAPRLPVPH